MHRYHATAGETGEHLARCMVFNDLNMVRAGVVDHLAEYTMCGYNENRNPSKRYTVIDYAALHDLFSVDSHRHFQQKYRHWVDAALKADAGKRKSLWSTTIAVGSEGFVDQVRHQLGLRA